MELIDTSDALARLAEDCAKAESLACDTEFMRERTYFPDLCLLQIACEDRIALVDPRALSSLQPLAGILTAPGIIKLMHAPRQDMEVLAPVFGAPPGPIYDTQLAAALCGCAPQISYAALVEELLGIDVGASHARTNWARRPLSEEQLNYAADDVRHLARMREALDTRLVDLGRQSWFDEDMQALMALPVTPDPATIWRRVKGHGSLHGRALALLVMLAEWRETTAISRDLPRQWLIPDRALIAIAQMQPRELGGLAAIEGVGPKLVRRDGAELLELVARSAQAEVPDIDRTEPDRKRVKALQARVRARAGELDIDPSVLATRADVVALALGRESRLTRGWRAEAIGNELAAAAG